MADDLGADLISFSRSVIRDQCSTSFGKANVRMKLGDGFNWSIVRSSLRNEDGLRSVAAQANLNGIMLKFTNSKSVR